MRKYYKTLKEARKAQEQTKEYELKHVFKKGKKYMVCTEIEYLNTY